MEKIQTTTIGSKKLPTHGREFQGVVTSDKMMDTVTVEWPRRRYVAKYQRYEKRRSKVKAHNPKEIDAKVGDTVRIVETRPISKTKSFIVTNIITKAEETSPTPKKVAAKKATKKKTPAKTATKKAEE